MTGTLTWVIQNGAQGVVQGPAWVMYWGALLPWWLATPALTWRTLANLEGARSDADLSTRALARRRLMAVEGEGPGSAATTWLAPMLAVLTGGSALVLAIAQQLVSFDSGMFAFFGAIHLFLGSLVGVIVVGALIPALASRASSASGSAKATRNKSWLKPIALLVLGLALIGAGWFSFFSGSGILWNALPDGLGAPLALAAGLAAALLGLARMRPGTANSDDRGESSPGGGSKRLDRPMVALASIGVLGIALLLVLVPSPGWSFLAGGTVSATAGVAGGAAIARRRDGGNRALEAAYALQLALGLAFLLIF